MIKIDLQFFGGRGASSGGGSGGSAKGELTLPNGSKIEFEGELKYGGNDAALTGKARQVVTDWEGKRVTAKVEYGYAVDADGNPVGREIRGGKGSVRTPYSYHGDGTTFTHIHPRDDGMLGGTFSGADMKHFANTGNKTTRAAAKEGTYSISKGANFDRSGFNSYVAKSESNFRKTYRSKADSAYQKYKAGNMSFDDYRKANAKAFNTALVQLHNDYSAGQKQYGYTYTLEKRGK